MRNKKVVIDVNRCMDCKDPCSTLYCDKCAAPDTAARYEKVGGFSNGQYVSSLQTKAIFRRLGFDPRED